MHQIRYPTISSQTRNVVKGQKSGSAVLQSDPNFHETHNSRPRFMTGGGLNDIFRDLQLPKSKAEQLGFCL